MTTNPILITGATGKTGTRIANLLEAEGHAVRRAGRAFSPRFDWTRPATFAPALRGCSAAYLCYYPDYAFPGTTATLTAFVEAARAADVQHIVMLAGRGESHAQQAEETVRAAGIPTSVMRSAWFAQNFSEGALLDAVHEGVIAMPGDDIREPVIDVDDLAAVACQLLRGEPANRTLELTGPESLTFAEMAAVLAIELDASICHQPVTFTEFREALAAASDPDYARIVTDIARETFDGRNAATTNDVQILLGRPPTRFAEFVRREIAGGAWQTHSLQKEATP